MNELQKLLVNPSDLPVEFAVDRFAFLVDQFEGVASVAVHSAVSVGRASIWEQEGHLVGGFRSEGDEVPEHVRILPVDVDKQKVLIMAKWYMLVLKGKLVD